MKATLALKGEEIIQGNRSCVESTLFCFSPFLNKTRLKQQHAENAAKSAKKAFYSF